MCGWVSGWKDGGNGWKDGWMDGWVGWVDAWAGWMAGWLDRWGGKAGKHRSFHLSEPAGTLPFGPVTGKALPYSLMRTDKPQCPLQKQYPLTGSMSKYDKRC